MLLAAAAGAAAQPPVPVPAVPAPPPPAPPTRSIPSDVRPPTPAPVPSRVVLFQKPAEEKTQPPAKLDKPTEPPEKPAETPEKSAEPGKPPPASTPPGGRSRREVARLENDDELTRRLIRELIEEERQRKKKDDPKWQPSEAYYRVPPVEPLAAAGTPYVTKAVREAYPPMRAAVEPDYVVHRRLYFEEQNSERYGWDLGIAQPFVSTLYFYKDTLLWPAKLASHVHERYDTSAGKCLPGSPVPYFLYPPEVDLFGAAVGAGTIIGVAAILP